MTTMNKWPQERHERLLVLIEAGLSASEIGAQLDLTRNAVLGYAHRKGLKLPMTAEKRARTKAAIRRRKPRGPAAPGLPPGRYVAPDHASRRSRLRGTRAFTDAEIATAIAAHLAGQSANKAARMVHASAQSLLKNWMKRPELVAAGRALFEQARADAAERAAARRELEAFEAEVRRVTVERTNWPILGRMSERHRDICERRIAGQTLQEVGDAFGVTRERVRQIEVYWRVRGLVVPGTRDLSAAALAKFAPRESQSRGRKPKATPDFWAQAAVMAETTKAKKPYRISDAERARRAEWMRSVGQKRWEHRA